MARDRKVQLAVDRIVLSGGYMGAAEVAEALGVEVTNLKWQKVKPVARISRGRIPVYLACDVRDEIKARGRRAAGSE